MEFNTFARTYPSLREWDKLKVGWLLEAWKR